MCYVIGSHVKILMRKFLQALKLYLEKLFRKLMSIWISLLTRNRGLSTIAQEQATQWVFPGMDECTLGTP